MIAAQLYSYGFFRHIFYYNIWCVAFFYILCFLFECSKLNLNIGRCGYQRYVYHDVVGAQYINLFWCISGNSTFHRGGCRLRIREVIYFNRIYLSNQYIYFQQSRNTSIAVYVHFYSISVYCFKRKLQQSLHERNLNCVITRCMQPQLWHGQIKRSRDCDMYIFSGDTIEPRDARTQCVKITAKPHAHNMQPKLRHCTLHLVAAVLLTICTQLRMLYVYIQRKQYTSHIYVEISNVFK